MRAEDLHLGLGFGVQVVGFTGASGYRVENQTWQLSFEHHRLRGWRASGLRIWDLSVKH